MIKKLLAKITKKPQEQKSFLQTHEFRLTHSTYHHIKIMGEKYNEWVYPSQVLIDFQVPNTFKRQEITDLCNSYEEAIDMVKLLCEYIVEIERGNVPKHIMESNMHDFYVIENL